MVYSEKVTLQREDPRLAQDPHKVYVTVFARFSEEGELEPLCIEWTDGRRYPIDRITDRRRAASLKAGGCGIRYTCMIREHRVRLFYEENYRWFVEANENAAEG